MKLIFMGTPHFAVPILKGLLEDKNFEIIAVYTQSPKEAGRGKKVTYSPIYLLAETYKIPVYCPLSLKKSSIEQEKLLGLGADKIVVAAYGLILPKKIVDQIHCINVHPSLLPRWRGAAPLQRTIMEGDKETGICIMKMDEGMDTGDILTSIKFPLRGNENFPEFSQLIAEQSSKLLKECLLNYDTIKPLPQSIEGITYANKIEKKEGLINWFDSAALIERKCRAFNPNPGIYFEYKNERFKILKADIEMINSDKQPGTVLDKNLSIVCGEGILKPTIIQKSGKNPLPISEFIKGFNIEIGTRLMNVQV